MFFKRFTCLNLILSFLLSTQTFANEVSGSYVYLPKAVSSNISTVDQNSSYSDRPLSSYDFEHFVSPIDKELDRMEVIHNILEKNKTIVIEPEQTQSEATTKSPTSQASQILIKSKITDKKVIVPQEIKTTSSAHTAAVPVVVKDSLPVLVQKKNSSQSNNASEKEIKTIQLDDIVSANPSKPSVRLIYNTSMIIESRNIQRYLAMDEGFIKIEKLDRNQIKLTAIRYGGTFLNVWDDAGRRTVYVGIIFPQSKNSSLEVKDELEAHEKPFRFLYSNDYNTYYFRPKGSQFKRQSYDLSQNYALKGQTPYGYFDTSMSMDNFNGTTNIQSYTVGLSQIPLEGVDDFNLRGFDATRDLSPLTMSNTHLRGFFADMDTLNDNLGISYSYGQKKPFFAFISQATPGIHSTYIDAFKFTLFPKDKYNQISINAAEGFGSQHEDTLQKKVYSIEARKKILDLYLNGEFAQSDNQSNASIVGMKFKQGAFTSGLNFRQTNKNFTTVSGIPGDQGEIGASWSTDFIGADNLTESTYLDIYRQYLFYNVNNPEALNLDASARLGVPLFNKFHSDTSIYYVDTSGEISPRRSINLDERISRGINFLGFKNTNVYVGAALQRVRYEASKAFAYDRSSFLSGMQIPLTSKLSLYANYDFSWVHELALNDNLTPNAFNTGFYYNKQLTDKLSGNFDMSYHKEVDVKGSTGYLAGEDSAGLSLGFSYNPANDVSFFIDGRLRKVWPLLEGNLPYNDLDIRLGMRMGFDVLSRGWDPSGVVSGHVYKDKNADGHFDPEDQGIKNAKVKIGHSETTTDANGYYHMDVHAKNVLVAPVSETLPAGVVFSTPTSKTLNISPWGATHADFGLSSQTGVYGLVFVDQNGNGQPDGADRFIKKVKVFLDKQDYAITDSQGAFYFRSLTPGKHVIRLDINSLPLNMIPQIKLETQINIVEGSIFQFHIPLKIKEEKEEKKESKKK